MIQFLRPAWRVIAVVSVLMAILPSAKIYAEKPIANRGHEHLADKPQFGGLQRLHFQQWFSKRRPVDQRSRSIAPAHRRILKHHLDKQGVGSFRTLAFSLVAAGSATLIGGAASISPYAVGGSLIGLGVVAGVAATYGARSARQTAHHIYGRLTQPASAADLPFGSTLRVVGGDAAGEHELRTAAGQ